VSEPIPAGIRLGIRLLRERNDTVKLSSYKDGVAHITSVTGETLTFREVYLKNGVPYMRELRNGTPQAEFKISSKKDEKPPEKPKVHRHKRRPRTAEVQVIERNPTLSSLFVERAEIQEMLKAADYEFTRNPSFAVLKKMEGWREDLCSVEKDIATLHMQHEMLKMVKA
jgi:hypothetical protein